MDKIFNPGSLDKKIDIQQAASTIDSYGQPIDTWAAVTGMSGVWASITTTGGGEFYAAQKLHSETSALFTIRYKAGVTTAMRVKYGDRYFEILGIADPFEQHKFLLLSCKEAV